MKRRIRAIAEGKFDYTEMEVHVSEQRIERMANKNEVLKGSFMLESRDERKLRGLVYTVGQRMSCEDVQFLGKKVQILYEFNTVGMEEGDTDKGEIYIESNAGEIMVPYVVSISRRALNSSLGRVQDLFHFANLAQTNYAEAYKLFCSRRFLQIRLDDMQKLIYKSLTQNNVCRENMEEFLIAIHKKQLVRFLISTEQENFSCEGDSFKKEILLSKNTWGYFTVHVTTDADFIYMDKPVVTADDFVGNHYRWEYIVEKHKLHAGINSTTITFSSGTQTEHVKLEIELPAGRARERTEEKRLLKELLELYIQVRNHSIKDAVWLKEAVKKAESLNGLVSGRPFYMLFQAQMYGMSGRQTEGMFLLNKCLDLLPDKEKQPALYAYYQYVQALLKKEEAYTQMVKQEVAGLSERLKHDFYLLLVRLFIDEQLNHNQVWKYRLLKEQFDYGCRSPLLYLEACLLIQQDHMSVYNRLEDFEQHIVAFAWKHAMLDEELLDKTAALALKLKKFEPIVFRVLTGAYDRFSTTACIEAICSMLIRSNRRNAVYFPWFERGVAAGLKLTQLFEYYLYTVPQDRKEMLPKTLLLYFNFDCSMDYKRKAYLFANVWRYQEQLAELFISYEPRIRIFVMDQLIQRHVTKDLVYLYQQLSADILQDAELSAILEELVFTRLFTCSNPNIRRAIVRHKELDKEEVFPVVDGRAWIKMYHMQAVLLLEDQNGRRHLDTIPYETEELFSEGDISRYCLKFSKVRLGLLLNRYNKKGAVQSEAISSICEKLLEKAEINEEFRHTLQKQLIEYYMDSGNYDMAEKHLLQLDIRRMPAKNRAYFLEMMITRGMYKRAYECIKRFGPEEIRPKRLVRLCSRLIDLDDVDEYLLTLCYYVFSKGKYDELVLEYLTKYYYGPTWQMEKLWRSAKQFDVETYSIDERTLTQMLFTGYMLPDSGELFEDYYRPGFKPEIVQAYLSYFSYYYVVHEHIIDERIFQWIEKEISHGELVNQDCRAALLKYYAQSQSVPEDKIPLLQEIVLEFAGKNLVFPFFADLDPKVTGMLHMNETTIIEHRAAPDRRVEIHYRIADGQDAKAAYTKEEMGHVYDSIYTKELVMFYGEQLQYYITESDPDGEHRVIVRSATLENEHSSMGEDEGRFQLLNEIAVSYCLKDEESLFESMEKYAKNEKCTAELFTLMELSGKQGMEL